MKKFLAIILLTAFAVPAMAQHHHFRHHPHHGHFARHGHVIKHYHHGGNWVAPLIIGGVVGAAIASRPLTQTETVIVQPQPVIVKPDNCTPWTETQQPDGTIVRTRTCVD